MESDAMTYDDRIHLSVDEARKVGRDAMRGVGYSDEEAAIIAEHVLDAALCGYEYSGLPKLLNVAEHPRQREPRRPLRVMRETDCSVQYDGGNNVGMYAMYRVAEAAIEKAQRHGIALIGLNDSWMSGRSAYYVEMVARANLVAIHTVAATSHVAPLGGTKKALGTNPIAFAFPTEREPVVIDLGTSAFMATDLQFRERRGDLLPEGVAIDAEGKPTRDPTAARAGALLPFAGYKGFVLAFAMQAFGVMAASGTDATQSYGYLMIAMKPDLLMPLDEFRRDMTALVARIKATPRAPGVDEIRIPSERSFRERAKRLAEGIDIDRKIYDRLVALSRGR
jgi:LDH2 family malate/lactate/ureidoglycolate dehydrogenase